MKSRQTLLTAILIAAMLTLHLPATKAGNRSTKTGGFIVEHGLTLPGTPDIIYDAMTGDISGWWDHSFSESPMKFYIEAKPGGGFYEIFDESGDGVLHATVIVAQRGKRLRFDGPLGLSGHAIKMVTTYDYALVGHDSTKVSVSVRASGEIQEAWPEVIDNVWHHFLFEQLQPYVEAGKHLER